MNLKNNEEFMNDPTKILNDLIAKYPTLREFAVAIGEEISDVSRWRKGRKLHPRAVINICRIFPEIKPNNLLPSLYPEDLNFIFRK